MKFFYFKFTIWKINMKFRYIRRVNKINFLGGVLTCFKENIIESEAKQILKYK